jgi:MFS family permease
METATGEFKEKRWLALILLCSAQFVVVLDASIVNVALPTIGKALDFSQENLPWVVNAYVLTFGGFLLLGGRCADLIGRRKVFMAGLMLVAVASLAAGFSATEGQLIVARAAQGLGAAIISPAALSIVTTTFSDGAERNKALGVWGAVWVNVPVSLIAFALSPRLLAETRAESEERVFDVAGAVTVTAALSILVYALVDANNAGWGSTQTIGLIALSVLLMTAFVAIELRTAKPLVPFSIFRIRTLTGANVVGLLVGASLFSMFFFISLYMQQVLGYSAIHAGLSYLPLALVIMASAGIASQLVTKIGYKPVLAIGLLFIVIGLAWFSRVSVGGGFLTDILGPSLFAAAGLGFAFVTTTIAAVSGVDENEAGLASGLINTSQQIGGALGLAVLSAVAISATSDAASTGSGHLSALTDGFQAAFLGGAVIAALGFVLTLVLIRGSDSRAHMELGTEAA